MIEIKKGIGVRLLRYVFVFYLFIAILVTGIQLVSEYRNIKNDTFDQLINIKSSFIDSFMSSMWILDIPQLETTLSGVANIIIVKGIELRNESDVVIASSGFTLSDKNKILSQESLLQSGMKEIVVQIEPNIIKTLFEYEFRLEYKDGEDPQKLIGYGRIYTDKETIINRVTYSFVLIIINSLVKTVALWFLFLFFINRFVEVPLQTLTETVNIFDPDKVETLTDYSVFEKLPKFKYKDQLYHLAASFDQMRLGIVDRINFIESQKSNLEEQILERTNSLLIVNKELKHLASHDDLTSLPNRAKFQYQLKQFLKIAYRNKTQFIVVSIDLTEFKEINDSYGHHAGDIVLIEVAKRLKSSLRDTDIVARIGGDEFYALMALDKVGMYYETICNKMINMIESPVLINSEKGEFVNVRANIGCAIYPTHGTEEDTLIRNADTAMYLAKKSGMNYAIYSTIDSQIFKREALLAKSFKTAIEGNELFLAYQPILDIKLNKVTKIEALVRWKHPTLGLIPPDEFIPICEKCSYIQELTQWVFYEACKDFKFYFDVDKTLSLSINLSGKVFSQPELPHLLENICKEVDLPPNCINLEVTETTAMDKPKEAIDILKKLNKMGFTSSIDDFGTGYSSFSYLKILPVHELKIDKSFLLEVDSHGYKIIKGMIELAHSLELKVVGEGVETEELLELLKKTGCDHAQGYYIAKPQPIDQISNYFDFEPREGENKYLL